MMTGFDENMLGLERKLAPLAATDAAILITGPSGTGKLAAARMVHAGNRRRTGPLVVVDCDILDEDENPIALFGPRGMQAAHRGTLVLSEIGQMGLRVQSRLLLALVAMEAGSLRAGVRRSPEIRFVSTTSHDLRSRVKQGRFKRALFYRLAVVSLFLPPLYQRRDELTTIIEKLVRYHSRRYAKPVRRIDPAAMAGLLARSWPGNLSELSVVMERAVVLCEDDVIDERCLVFDSFCKAPVAGPLDSGEAVDLKTLVHQTEKHAIRRALAAVGDNRTRAARLLGINRRTLYDKLALHGLS